MNIHRIYVKDEDGRHFARFSFFRQDVECAQARGYAAALKLLPTCATRHRQQLPS